VIQPPATPPLLPRGVFRAPVLGPAGEIILFAVDSRHTVPDGARVLLEPGSDLIGPTASLWRLLDAVDPEFSRRRAVREQAVARAS
jgi:hypothetical protein